MPVKKCTPAFLLLKNIIRILLYTVSCYSISHAQDTLTLPIQQSNDIGNYIYVLEDSTAVHPPSAIYHAFADNKGKQLGTSFFNIGYSFSSHWFFLNVYNSLNSSQTYYLSILDPHLSSLEQYKVDKAGHPTLMYSMGDTFPFKYRPLKYKDFVFPIHLGPNETQTILFKVNNTGNTSFFPILLKTLEEQQSYIQAEYLVWGLLSGILIFVCFFSFFMYISLRDRIYLFYGLYVSAVTVYIWANSGLGYQYIWPEFSEVAQRIRFLLVALTSGLSLHIMQLFVDQTPKNSHFYYGSNVFKYMFFALVIISMFPFNFMQNHRLIHIAMIFVDILLIISIILILLGLIEKIIQKKNSAWYYLTAISLLLIGVGIHVLMHHGILPPKWITLNCIYIGYLAEILVLSFILSQRYNLHTKEREILKTQLYEHEKQETVRIAIAKERERKRIASDMHDDLGSGLSGIRLMSELSSKKSTTEELQRDARKISLTADNLTTKMREIIWALDHESDTAENLLLYIQKYGSNYFNGTNIRFEMLLPLHLPQIKIGGEERRHIYLSTKEIFNNTLKHSEATTLKCEVSFSKQHLFLQIRDNGKGFTNNSTGNGLRNIRERIQTIGGYIDIESSNGVYISIQVPFEGKYHNGE